MEQAMDQHRLESKTFGFQNKRVLEQVISKDIVNIVVNAFVNNASVSMSKFKKCLELENELLNKQDFIEKEKYDKLLSSYATLEKHYISLDEQALVIIALKEELRKLKGKAVVENAITSPTIAPKTYEIDVQPLASRLLHNRIVHSEYLSNHDLCALNVTNDVNARFKSKFVKKTSKRKVWKPIGKVFNKTGYIWRPAGQTFTIVGNACPLTRIIKTTEVPLRKPIALEIDTPKPVVTLVYSRKPRRSKTSVLASKHKINKSMTANNKEPIKFKESKVSNVPSSSLDECMLFKLFSRI
nr:hypothetical protein [Tanacetum cinerariifolium]